ncbi:SGNH hydrolase-type esterase domain-containing protein [Mycena maculata]|uniref:SGNH hydrolase-type esterase domain-containing protein n=1 Tax=Mycena maculata TaxID=230809 RepID=A0AAD7MMW3_9AGAR|nr:SGNH hydrolase-type esterase domain-containing protein [Mycena maculata]
MLVLNTLHYLAAISFLSTANAMIQNSVTIRNTDPLIYFTGRWDSSPGTWWASSGFKLNVKNFQSLALNLGPHTTTPFTSVGVSLDYGEFITVNISEGSNSIPIPDNFKTEEGATTVVRVNVEGWQNNRMNLESIILNQGASLVPYIPSELVFQFIGDSLSAGQYLPEGVNQAWPFLIGETFKAEHRINAQPGAALSDIVSYGNEHGVSCQFFRTEDTGYFYTTDHNFTTPWDFARDQPGATHLVIHIGANDASQNVTDAHFVQVYTDFIARLRTVYRVQPIFVFTPWGWPNPVGPPSQYYQGQYQKLVDLQHESGDENVFLVNTTGWVTYADVFPDNLHPTVPGHEHIASEFQAWLENWGLKPESRWAAPA